MRHPRRNLARWGAMFAGMLLLVISSGCSQSGAERDAKAGAQASPQDAASDPSKPFVSSTVSLRPGQVTIIRPGVSGPAEVRVVVKAPQKVSFGFAPQGEMSDYQRSWQVENAMVRLPCGSGGEGEVTRSCEFGAEARNLLLVVADLRDFKQTTRAHFDEKRRGDPEPSYSNTIEVSIYVANSPNGSGQKP